MNLVQQAVFLCRNDRFQWWIARRHGYISGTLNEAKVGELLRKELQINSRSELDTNLEARERFLKLKTEFEAYRVGSAA